MRVSPTHLFSVSSLLMLAVALGCSGQEDQKQPKDKKAAQSSGGDDHAHPEEGPHHGQLIELGNEEYHAELVHDDEAGSVTIYLLDSSAKKPVATELEQITLNITAGGKPQQFSLPAAPQESDPAGQSSRFKTSDKAVGEALDGDGSTGRLSLMIDGKPYSGAIEQHEHAEHGEHEHQ